MKRLLVPALLCCCGIIVGQQQKPAVSAKAHRYIIKGDLRLSGEDIAAARKAMKSMDEMFWTLHGMVGVNALSRVMVLNNKAGKDEVLDGSFVLQTAIYNLAFAKLQNGKLLFHVSERLLSDPFIQDPARWDKQAFVNKYLPGEIVYAAIEEREKACTRAIAYALDKGVVAVTIPACEEASVDPPVDRMPVETFAPYDEAATINENSNELSALFVEAVQRALRAIDDEFYTPDNPGFGEEVAIDRLRFSGSCRRTAGDRAVSTAAWQYQRLKIKEELQIAEAGRRLLRGPLRENLYDPSADIGAGFRKVQDLARKEPLALAAGIHRADCDQALRDALAAGKAETPLAPCIIPEKAATKRR